MNMSLTIFFLLTHVKAAEANFVRNLLNIRSKQSDVLVILSISQVLIV